MLGENSPKIIKFRKIAEEYGWMSNFSKHPIKWNNKIYPTSEHLYQALKATNEEDHEKVRLAKTAKEAADIGRSLTSIKPDWDQIKVHTMYIVLQLKIEQHPQLKEMLIQTGDAIIQEDGPWDEFWATGKEGKGKNILGLLWMCIRAWEQLGNVINKKEI